LVSAVIGCGLPNQLHLLDLKNIANKITFSYRRHCEGERKPAKFIIKSKNHEKENSLLPLYQYLFSLSLEDRVETLKKLEFPRRRKSSILPSGSCWWVSPATTLSQVANTRDGL
jgi:hypothetical protein